MNELHFHGAGRYDVHLHIHGEGLQKILTELQLLNTKIEKMAETTKAQFDALFARFDTATTQIGTAVTSIGTRIASLEETVKGLGLPAEQEAQILSQTEGIVTFTETLASSLNALGKVPEAPLPPAPEPLPEVTQ